MTERIVWTGSLLRWGGDSGAQNWFYFAIDGAAAEELAGVAMMRRLELGKRQGFGSVKVAVRIGETRWASSVFPQKGGNWLLPVKATVRKAEHIGEGDLVTLELEVL